MEGISSRAGKIAACFKVLTAKGPLYFLTLCVAALQLRLGFMRE
jgi:hypothetical protein